MNKKQTFEHPCLCNICLKARDDEIRKVRINVVEKIFDLLIKYYEGNISKMKLAEDLRLSFSQTKIYVEKIEKIIIDEYEEFEEEK